MKHLMKKYVRCTKVGDDVAEVITNLPMDENSLNETSNLNLENYCAIALTEENELVQTFKYIDGEKVFLIPEPDPIVIYFDTARHFHKDIKGKRNELFANLTTTVNSNLLAANGSNFYWYFPTVCNYIIFLFLSLEAFINKSIPNGYEYRKKIQNKKVEL